MLDRETLLTLFKITMESLAINLDYIPVENLNWKPAPEAKSALEIVNHLTEFVESVTRRLGAEEFVLIPATNAQVAKHTLSEVAPRFIEAVRGASSQLLGDSFREDLPFTNGWIATAVIMDAVHHHGQIAYIQTLLGDTEIHAGEGAVADFALG